MSFFVFALASPANELQHDSLFQSRARDTFQQGEGDIPEVENLYRIFEVPGLLHYSSVEGGQPTNTF